MKNKRVVIRKGSLLEDLYLQPDNTWGDYRTAKLFTPDDEVSSKVSQLNLGENYGTFP